jgi:hypothetical protein
LLWWHLNNVQSLEPGKNQGLRVWSSRHKVNPSFSDRINSATKSIFFIGFTFEATMRDYSELFKDALTNNSNLMIKLLLIHPDSLHVSAHQDFTVRNIAGNIDEAINVRLKSLFDTLSPSARRRLMVRATYYLPRFAARIFDDEVMLLNFYLYGIQAQANPVIEVCHDKHEKEFNRILTSLNDLFDAGVGNNGNTKRPNHLIIDGGTWNGLPVNSE